MEASSKARPQGASGQRLKLAAEPDLNKEVLKAGFIAGLLSKLWEWL